MRKVIVKLFFRVMQPEIDARIAAALKEYDRRVITITTENRLRRG